MAKVATKPKTVRISLNDDVERLLDAMKQDYPALDYAEIFKLSLSETYRRHELESRQAWIDSLPTLELTDEEQESLTEGIKELEREKKAGTLKAMNIDEVMSYLKSEDYR